MILVTGATGTVGSRVLAGLLDAGVKARALTRDPARAALPAGAEAVAGDLARPETLGPALEGVEKVFLMALGHHKAVYDAHLVEAARAHGVRHVVQLSTLGVAEAVHEGEDNELARWHREAEDVLTASGLDWTILRPGEFMSNALAWAASVKSGGTARGPAPDLLQVPTDPADIAAVAVTALLGTGHEGRVYPLTGPEPMTPADQLATLGEVLGRPLRFERITVAEQRAVMLRHLPPETVDGVLGALEQALAGDGAFRGLVLPTVPDLLGRPARSFRDWARAHADAFR
ncbi:NAD(P)H-binding protein [Streptomyces sp. I05A-00742]|uniref:NAD(P)H-binding protein n=1 Tax=Streptomyces sp. I05A-00742 TaxID=2732853 RepID=UPI00148900C8|nr:NAD(P)H-binding protein [Streptomyces sp. I05A-00742]